MADSKISALTELAQGTIANTDLLPVVDTSATATKKYTWLSALTDIKAYLDTFFVPYTGATTNVDLGANTLHAQALSANGTGGNGHLHLKHQSSDASATGSSTVLFADSNGDIKYKNDGGYYTTFVTSSNTADRAYTLPNVAGTVTLNAATQTLTGKTLTDAVNDVSTPTTTSVGYLGIPQNSQSTAYTLVLSDAGKHILHPTADNNARTFTIPANSSVAYPIGTTVTFINQINTVTISITTDTLTLAGTGTTGSRTLAANGIATAVKVGSTSWVINGTGLT